MKQIRIHLTFMFDDTKVAETDITDRLDKVLVAEFGQHTDVDVPVRWIVKVADSPVFGAATRRPPRSKGGA